ncbi:DUF1800 domain-containing protein [Aestuariibaculum sediminum]|uniref:DUF1800 domain-containing protein n=1 Tax=Aestuariibaculum sediminum TaxID=2770637 RepID=A0A8J6UBN7_9FLAO|nr:DUF1800 domain-containing protein [Aestuariibaculum sediminum]MBD0831119.1 DUF1800 domain-containing protein [Aestuariibaculum sediminum]
MKLKHIQHLYWRAGFGILPNDLEPLKDLKRKAVVDLLFKNSEKISPLNIDTSELNQILKSGGPLSDVERKKIQQLSRKKSIELNMSWMQRMMKPWELLREKMTLFWANVFVCEDNNVVYTQKYNNTLRTFALGNFKDFVNAISKEAAMTKYLNTKQNKKQKPNENFARELMELFTLGEGHYTEEDIKESAKAFTGYSHNLEGDFVLRAFQHDNSYKVFFGETGNFDGADIIDIILKQRQCAKFICEKIYAYFVNDRLNAKHINEMVDVFYRDYNIKSLMHFVFCADWFYDDENIGIKIKSPVELLVGINHLVPIRFENKKQLLYLQRQLGQVLLDPPNVAGWKGSRSWIDSNTISLRLKLPSILLNDAYISKVENDESESMMLAKKQVLKNRVGKQFKIQRDWNFFENCFKQVPSNKLQDYVLMAPLSSTAEQYLSTLNKTSKQEYCVQLMSLPEYQMC